MSYYGASHERSVEGYVADGGAFIEEQAISPS
jgi:hypothetical protein